MKPKEMCNSCTHENYCIKESGERKEQQIQKAEAEQATPAPQPIAQPQQEMPEDSEDTTEVKKFVICPKCGEKIWL